MDNTSAERLLEESKRRSVPGLHPGLNDLIRVLGKQAHCASRTLILCEPHIPSKFRKTNYHKHCSPKRRSSAETIVRSSALWCPVRPDNYYYDCFNYTHYPERETDYLDIQNRYKALKDKPLSYSPPKCDEDRIRRSLESPTLKHKRRTDHMTNSHPRPPKTTGNITDFISSSSIIPSTLLSDSGVISPPLQKKIEVYSSQEVKEPTVNSTVTKGGGERGSETVPCAELIDLRNLIRKSDRENFERMQQMLTLMKELSAKDFCRATCDQVVKRFDEMGYGKRNGRDGDAEPPETYEKKPKPAEGKRQNASETKKPVKNKLNDYESNSDSEKGSDHLTDSSTSSVTSSEGPSRKVPSSKSKSSTNVTESSSEESLKPPLLSGKEGSKDKFEESESNTSILDRAEVAEESSRSVSKPDALEEIASPHSDSSARIKEKRSTDSMKVHYSEPSTESARSATNTKDILEETNTIDEQFFEPDWSKKSDNLPSDHDSKRNPQLTVCDSPMTVHELVEVSNIITDIVVLETVNELMKRGIYTPPSRRQRETMVRSPSTISEGTNESPFQVRNPPKSIIADRSNPKDLKSVSLPKASVESQKSIYKEEQKVKPNKTTGISESAKGGLPDELTSQTESFTSRGRRKPESKPFPNTTNGVTKGETMKNKMDRSKKASSPDDLKSQVDSFTSGGSREQDKPMKSKTAGARDASSDEQTSQVDSFTSRASRKPVSTTPSKASGVSKMAEVPKVDSIKSNVTGRSARSDKRDPSIDKATLSKQGSRSKMSEGSRVGPDRSNILVEGEPGYESMKSKAAKPSEVGSMLSRIDEESTISRTGDTSKMGSMKSSVSEQSEVGLKGNTEYSNIDSRKSRVSEESGIKSFISKRSEESRTEPVHSKTSMKLKSIEERIETSKISSNVSGKSDQSEGGPRVGHRRSSSCRLYSKSPSPSADRSTRADESNLTPVTSDRNKIKDVRSYSSMRSQKERRSRLSGEGTKLSTVDSVCDREDSQNCVDYETDSTVLYYVRISENAYPPEKETYCSAGFMLKSAYDYTIPPRGKVNVKTDLVLELPPNSYGRIAPRKCLAINFGIDVGADVIDRDCRENVTVLLFNHSDRPFSIKRGNKVAQLICESIHQAAAKEKCDLINST